MLPACWRTQSRDLVRTALMAALAFRARAVWAGTVPRQVVIHLRRAGIKDRMRPDEILI